MIVNRDNSFNFIRLFAAIQVVFFHTYAALNLHSTFGGTLFFDALGLVPGVPIFFAISGYLITQSFERSKCLSSFYKKRIYRIYPALILNILVIESVLFLFNQHPHSQSSFISLIFYEIIYILTASANIAYTITPISVSSPNGFFFSQSPTGVLWTLTVELTFYIFLPIIINLSKQRFKHLVLALSILSFSFSLFFVDFVRDSYPSLYKGISITFIPYFWMFAIGIMLSKINFSKVSSKKFTTYLFINISLLAIMVGFMDNKWLYWKYNTNILDMLFIVALLVFVILLGNTRIFSMRGIIDGDYSYGIYLWHMFIITTLLHTPAVGNPAALFLVYFLSFVLAAFSWVYIERPSIQGRLHEKLIAWTKFFQRKV